LHPTFLETHLLVSDALQSLLDDNNRTRSFHAETTEFQLNLLIGFVEVMETATGVGNLINSSSYESFISPKDGSFRESVDFSIPLKNDIDYIRSSLLSIIGSHCGRETYEAVEKIRELSYIYDTQQEDANFAELCQYIESLPEDKMLMVSNFVALFLGSELQQGNLFFLQHV